VPKLWRKDSLIQGLQAIQRHRSALPLPNSSVV
jgi:hypothetical protein